MLWEMKYRPLLFLDQHEILLTEQLWRLPSLGAEVLLGMFELEKMALLLDPIQEDALGLKAELLITS